ncbi:PIN domain-containing protein [Candidatus Woesearchaeota archaeon]|nr:PIN domain-containing protein [Candidatus Woesearchaeota archaeon]
MHIIIDSNVLFSAIIKDSTTRRLILEYPDFFLFPAYIFEEMNRHKEELAAKSKMDEMEFHQLFGLMLQKMAVVPFAVSDQYHDDAQRLAKRVGSPEDVEFFACALAYPGSVIWSNDARLKNQSQIRVISTAEAMKIL